MKRRQQGALHGGRFVGVCAYVVEIKDMTWENDAKLHLLSKVVLLGPTIFKNRAFLMENRAKGKAKNSESSQRLEKSSVERECNLRLTRLLFPLILFSPPRLLMKCDMHTWGP